MKRAAFSLVEMLVAIVLVTLLVGVAMFAFKHQLIMIKKTKSTGINRAIIYNQIKTSVESIKYYVVDDYNIFDKPMKNLHYFFNGYEDSIEYITVNPLFSKEISVAKFVCEEGDLVYKEEPLYKRINFLKPSLHSDSKEQILLRGLEACSFFYIYNNEKTTVFKKNIPQKVVFVLKGSNMNSIYIDIKSDYNISKFKIKDAIYPLD